jgi:hypothetical protein
MDASEDVLGYRSFPANNCLQITSTHPLERVNREIKRRANAVGIFPNGAVITRLVDALMLKTNDERAVAGSCMSLRPWPGSPILRSSGCSPWHPEKTYPRTGVPTPTTRARPR